MLIESPAIIIKQTDFRESSKIITFFSRQYGKTAILAKGVKRGKSKYGGILGFGAILNVMFYYKENRSVQTFKQAEVKISTIKLQADFEKLSIAMALLELIDGATHENEPNPELYDFLESFLGWLNNAEVNAANIFPYLQLRIAEINGFGLQLMDDAVEADLYMNVTSGNLATQPDSGLSFKLKPIQSLYVRTAMEGKSARLLNMKIEKKELKSLVNHLDVYLKHHIEGLRDRKSDAIFEQLLT